MDKLIYLGLFLTEASRLLLHSKVPPLHEQSFGSHVTLAFRPKKEVALILKPFAGMIVPISVYSVYFSFKAQAVGVEIPGIGVYPEIPHITISTAKDIQPKESLDLIKSGNPLPIERILLHGMVGCFPTGSWPE